MSEYRIGVGGAGGPGRGCGCDRGHSSGHGGRHGSGSGFGRGYGGASGAGWTVRGAPQPFAQPVALAVAADPGDFERLRRHRLFGRSDHPGYLRRTERQLRALRGLGLAVHLRLLDAAGYEDFCAQRLLAPADPVARAAFAADPEYLGDPFVYAGQRLPELLPALVRDHRVRERIAAGCTALLDAVESGGRTEERLGEALGYAAEVWLALESGAGPGRWRLQLRAEGPGREELTAGTRVASAGQEPGGAVEARESEAFCVTLAAVLAGRCHGELLLRGTPSRPGDPGGLACPIDPGEPGAPIGPDGPADSVEPGGRRAELRGWSVADGRLTPLTRLEVRAAAADCGPGVVAREAFPLPEPPARNGPARSTGPSGPADPAGKDGEGGADGAGGMLTEER